MCTKQASRANQFFVGLNSLGRVARGGKQARQARPGRQLVWLHLQRLSERQLSLLPLAQLMCSAADQPSDEGRGGSWRLHTCQHLQLPLEGVGGSKEGSAHRATHAPKAA
jgi:hypothetical protein